MPVPIGKVHARSEKCRGGWQCACAVGKVPGESAKMPGRLAKCMRRSAKMPARSAKCLHGRLNACAVGKNA